MPWNETHISVRLGEYRAGSISEVGEVLEALAETAQPDNVIGAEDKSVGVRRVGNRVEGVVLFLGEQETIDVARDILQDVLARVYPSATVVSSGEGAIRPSKAVRFGRRRPEQVFVREHGKKIGVRSK